MRQPIRYDPATRRLTVGDRSTIVPAAREPNEAMLRGYLALVTEARGTAVGTLRELRQDDVAVLAEVLDLDDADLEARFVRLLGMTTSGASDARRRLLRHRALLAAAGVTVGLLTPSLAAASPSGPAATITPVVVSAAAVASDLPLAPDSTPAPPATSYAPDAAVTPATTADESQQGQHGDVEIGTAMVIERGTPSGDPNVDIGDTVVYEQ